MTLVIESNQPLQSKMGLESQNGRIDPSRWYTAAEAAPFFEVKSTATVKRYCRDGDVRPEGMRRKGRRQVVHIKGSEIIRLRKKWSLDSG